MKQALEQLSVIDRAVFLLREVSGLSYEQIAVSCEISPLETGRSRRPPYRFVVRHGRVLVHLGRHSAAVLLAL
jgi:hypothetical protein